MDFNGIILLSDMDGTLLNSKNEISKENKEAISYYTANGGLFGVATGRAPLNAIDFLQGLPINLPCICYNGGGLYDYSKEKYIATYELIKNNLYEYLNHILTNHPEVMIQVYTDVMCHIISQKKLAAAEMVSQHQPCIFSDLNDIKHLPWIKILFCGTSQQLLHLKKMILQYHIDQNISSVFSSSVFLEFLPKNVTKGSMILKLRSLLGNRYKIYAVGDYYNDEQMLINADVGIATFNAPDDIKQIADMTTVSNDQHALADIIHRIIPKTL